MLKRYNKKKSKFRSWIFDIWSYMKIMSHDRKCVMVDKSPPPLDGVGVKAKEARKSITLILMKKIYAVYVKNDC